MNGSAHNEIIFSNKKEMILIITWMNLKIIVLSERSQITKEYIPYDSIYMSSRKRKLIYNVSNLVAWKWECGEGWMRGRLKEGTRKLRAVRLTFVILTI